MRPDFNHAKDLRKRLLALKRMLAKLVRQLDRLSKKA